jgi:hypothetical protein
MSTSFGCNCPERKKPIEQREWYVTEYKWNSGAFTSGHGERSEYSSVWCLGKDCTKGVGRTKAKYVEKLRRLTFEQLQEIRKTIGANAQ